MADNILETDGLTKEFRGFVAVNNVALRVRRHSIHALIGPNGAGKTTCFNLLTKFLIPSRGKIAYNGRDITATKPADIARLGRVTRARVTQIMDLLLLAPDLQEALLFLPAAESGYDPIHLKELRYVCQTPIWAEQRARWLELGVSRAPQQPS